MCKRKYIFISITILWVGIIFWFSLQPGDVSSDMSATFGRKMLAWLAPGLLDKVEVVSSEQLEFWHFLMRKGAHFLEYLVLGILSALTLSEMRLRHKNIWAVGFCVMVAAMDETIQLFVPGRAGRIMDVYLDSIGAVTGMMVLFCCHTRRKGV